MSWRDWPRAPAPGTVLCAQAAVAPAISLDLDGFPVLLVQGPAGLAGYVNACPHQYLPLDFHGPNILSNDGTRLICTAHQACFNAGDGTLICGPAEDGLDALPLAVIDGMVMIAAD